MGVIKEHRLNNKFNNNILSVIFDSDSFFYSVSDNDHNLYMAIKHHLDGHPVETMQEIIKSEQLHLFDYAMVKVYSKFSKFTLFPSDEMISNNAEVLAKNAFHNDSGQITIDHNQSESIDIIHSFPESYEKIFGLLAENVKIRHLSRAWIDLCKNDGMYVYLYPNQFSILITKNEEFVFYNSFHYASKEDAFYFIMLGFQEFEMNPDEDYIFIDGMSTFKSDLKEMLKNYVHHVSKVRRGFNNIPDSSDILDLYAASICV